MKKALVSVATILVLTACNDSNSPAAADDTPEPTATPLPTGLPDPSASPLPTATPAPTPLPDFGEKGACLVPADAQSTVSSAAGAGCISCTVTTPEAVVSGSLEDSALMAATLSVLPAGGQSDLSLLVELPETVQPDQFGDDFTKPDAPGFVVSFPDPALAAAAVLPEVLFVFLMDGSVVDSVSSGFGFGDSIALGTLLQNINNAQVFLTLDEPSAAYNALRISLTGTVLNTLIEVNVHEACISGVAGSISGDF